MRLWRTDAEIAEKGHIWMETSFNFRQLINNYLPVPFYRIQSPAKTAD
jgi:hypothetical protein